MANAITYSEFFRYSVLRKRQDLVNPQFLGIGEVILPKNSLLHFIPKNPADYGPSNSEAFVQNFPGDVYISFVDAQIVPIMGHGRVEVFDVKKAIQAYRAGHYNYNWTRDISNQYPKELVLIVDNYALISQRFTYRPSLFVNYEKYYNLQSLLIENINKEAIRSNRHQFMRVELPLNMPGFTELVEDYGKFIASFKDGKPVPSQQIVESTKAENSYWLLDMLGFLVGQYEYSLFGKLSDKALENLHVVFTFQSKALIIKLGLIKEWLDEVGLKPGEVFKTPREQLEKIKGTSRMNVVKRMYLAFMGLSRSLVPEKEIVKEEQHVIAEDAGRETSGQNSKVDSGTKGKEKERSKDSNGKERTTSGKDASSATGSGSGSVLDVLAGDKKNDGGLPKAEGGSAEGSDTESVEEWTSQVDDSLLEVEKVSGEVTSSKVAFPTPESGVKRALDARAREGGLTVAEQEFFMRKAMRFQHIEMPNGQTFEEFIKITQAELDDIGGKIEGEFTTIIDQSMLDAKITAFKNDYAKKFLHKDIASMFLGVQNAGFAMNDYRMEQFASVQGSYDVHSVQLHEVNGDQITIHPRMPTVSDDGTYMIDGVKQHFQIQRREKPFRKISPYEVALTSYYDRKIMVSRSEKMVDNLSNFMVKQIAIQSELKHYTFSKGDSFNRDYNPPRIYSLLARQYSHISVDGYDLDFHIANLLKEYPDFKKYTKKERFLVGVKDGEALTLDDYGNLYKGDDVVNTIEGLLGIDLRKAPLEHAVINISGYSFPLGVVLCFYFGIDELLRITKATTRSVPIGTRPKLSSDEFAIQFNDQYLIFNRREKLTTLIFGGLPRLNNISNFSKSDLNNNSIWTSLIGDPRVRPSQFQEMKNLFDLFIDPITRDELKKMKLSESFNYLLIDAAKALETDFSRHEVEIEEQRLVGYERFAGHVYTELVKAIRQYRNKGKNRKHKLDFNPDSVLIAIGKDTSGQQVEEVNPVHQLKDQEEVTFGGTGGRNEITMVKRARTQRDTYMGIIGEANKDSGKVGFVTYTTSDPAIADFRGNIDKKKTRTPVGDSSVTMNLVYGGRHDDAKRAVFTSTQWSQAISASNYGINSLRTGYENIVAHRTSELYSKVAKQAGTVTEVKDDELVVTYADKTIDRYPLGLKVGEASGEYHRHTRITDMKVGQKFKKGDVIGWDSNWFDRDIFCPGQVGLKSCKMVRIGLFEDQDVYEDSIAVSADFARETHIPYLKTTGFVMNVDWNLLMKVKVGDEVEQDAILCDIEEPHLVAGGHQEELIENLNRLGIKQVKANHHGTIVDIQVLYNGALDKMSDSVRSFVVKHNKITKRKNEIIGSDVETNAVPDSFNVNRPSVQPDTMVVMIVIESMDGRTRADKFVLGNQLKATIGRVMTKPLMTEDREPIDIKTSSKAPFNRMVVSFRNKLICGEFSWHFTKHALSVYGE